MIDYANLSAVAAVVRTGSFEKAAQSLNITASAVSQRVKLLEEKLGTSLVVRGQPCTATPAGNRLCRHLEDVGLLENNLRADLGALVPAGPWPTIRIAVNADSLATWFIKALAQTNELLFELIVDDQDHSADWLRKGEVAAAVTASPVAVRGCDILPLGSLRYFATATPQFVATWFADGVNEGTLQNAPSICFDKKDELQSRWIKQQTGKHFSLPVHWMPSSHAFIDGALAGLGWGMNPELLISEHLAAQTLQKLPPGTPLDTPLYWQYSRVIGKTLAPLTKAVTETARAALVQ
ncbi:LysR family transcriptional regulator ArgP [Aureimonas fodinaquatilis]|uniref:LysR family transcriptional regulator ArgP n=1 Tax=Aureimonas fodinaquatilis TaxID=2565783 RepID=A0A5B0E0C3_9HYPH|nr:LysR family transcriptional regulator ArgP [Aureimonas fodinaquatilis]KAA0970929.1 LysR family transcriptional regulator ArgP [Aureimonas fodinaquatilis]